MPTPTYGHSIRHDQAMLNESLAQASSTPFWLDTPDRPEPRPALQHDLMADLLVIGGGFCGLWTALIAKERHPEWNIILLEQQRIAWAASGRNGGFCESSLTHGDENGELHYPDELPIIHKLADQNFAEIAATIERYNIDAEWETGGIMVVATEPHQEHELRASTDQSADAHVLDMTKPHGYGASPVYRAGVTRHKGYAHVHPAKLAWGLAQAAENLGVQIFENTKVTELSNSSWLAQLTRTTKQITAHTPEGTVTAQRVALATNVFPSLLRRLRLFTVPIYDYALMTEPLTQEQLQAIDWTRRNGITDSGREFHYYRKTSDNRILFGGWDAVYHWGRKVQPSQDQRHETFLLLADHFFTTFPALQGIGFTHAWGGAIDMSTQLMAFHGKTRSGNIAYSAGYTGLGVGATRFGASVMLDLLEGSTTQRTELTMTQRLPIPIPPEPIAYPLIHTIRRAVARSDRRGKDGLLLKLMGFFKVGFDS